MGSDWQQAKRIFNDALELEASEREAFLQKACGTDGDLRSEVDSLLAAFSGANDFLHTPAIHDLQDPTLVGSDKIGVGKMIGPYTIVGHAGSGGMGQAYLARDPRLDRTVVLKFISDALQSDDSSRKRFLHEARMASAVDHPNVCTIYEISQYDDIDVIVMQYAQGRTLKEELAHGPVELDRLLEIATQITSGLAAAHDEGIIHRDLKPANIIITPKGQVKILDFGLAKPLDRRRSFGQSEQITQAGTIIGTPAYMSPEQVRSGELDARSDIFSLGTILYEMLTGRSAFSGPDRSTIEILHSVVYEDAEPIESSDDPDRTHLSDVIRRCLEKEPQNRYETTHALAGDLSAISDKTHENMRPVSSTKVISATTRSSPSRIPRQFGWSVLTIIVALALGIGGWLGARQFFGASTGKKAPRSIAILPLKNLTGDAGNDYLSDGITESVIDSLSKVGELKVIPRASSFRYRDNSFDPVEVGKQLSIDAMLDGSMRKEGDALKISIRMISAADRSVIWSSPEFKGGLGEIFALQDEIAKSVGTRLQIASREMETASTPPKTDPETYRLFLMGRFSWNQMTRASLEKSIEYFNLAIAKDPTFALAYVGLADSYVILAQDFEEPRTALQKANTAAKRALELDDSLAAAHVSMGNVRLFYDWDWAGARLEADRAQELNVAYKRAMEITTEYGDGHHFYCGFLEAVGEADRSVVEIKRAMELDPLSTMLSYELGMSYYMERNYDEALRISDDLSRSGFVENAYPYFLRANVLEQKGRYNEAIDYLIKGRNATRDAPVILAELGYSYAKSGKLQEARSVISDLQKQAKTDFIDPYDFAVIYLALGQVDETLAWLNKALDVRSVNVVYLNVEPKFDPLRSDPRFVSMLRRMNVH